MKFFRGSLGKIATRKSRRTPGEISQKFQEEFPKKSWSNSQGISAEIPGNRQKNYPGTPEGIPRKRWTNSRETPGRIREELLEQFTGSFYKNCRGTTFAGENAERVVEEFPRNSFRNSMELMEKRPRDYCRNSYKISRGIFEEPLVKFPRNS